MKTGITTDCFCDLPEAYIKAHSVGLMYCNITTDTGRFRDGVGITSQNILEYLEEGGTRAETSSPSAEEYRAFFEAQLKRYDELVHIAVSSGVGSPCANAKDALNLMGEDSKRVVVIDSQHLSTGMGHMVMRAVELRDQGESAASIAGAVTDMIGKISTSFITRNADYLYHSGKVSPAVRTLCEHLRLHPVLAMKNGRIALQGFQIGSAERAVIRYIRKALKHSDRIDHRRVFITHAGCTVRMLAQFKIELERLCMFDEVIVTQASAAVSVNCGPGTIGVLYLHR